MIQIDADEGAVRIELPNGEALTIDGVQTGVQVGRALFLEREEAETLAKMIDYILEKVRIKPESEAALRSVRPRLDQFLNDASLG
jgi:hypothetical protein